MVIGKFSLISLITCVLIGFANAACSINKPATAPVPMEFVRVVYDGDTKAIVSEFVIPKVVAIEDLSRIEMLINQGPDNKPKFGTVLNYSDRCNPIPPEAFGVIINPANSDRSIKNVASAGINGQWDQPSANGTLLAQSVSGLTNGNLGISFWVRPKDWEAGNYTIHIKAVRDKGTSAPWQKLATFEFTGDDVTQVVSNQCLVKPIFINASNNQPIDIEHVGSLSLIHYRRQKQDKGVEIKRWAGDTTGQYKYVEIEKRTLKPGELADGLITLRPGIYQFKHNSVTGMPPSGFYGESRFFEIKSGQEFLEVQVPLYSAI